MTQSHEHGLYHRRLARQLQPLAVRAPLVRVEQRVPQRSLRQACSIGAAGQLTRGGGNGSSGLRAPGSRGRRRRHHRRDCCWSSGRAAEPGERIPVVGSGEGRHALQARVRRHLREASGAPRAATPAQRRPGRVHGHGLVGQAVLVSGHVQGAVAQHLQPDVRPEERVPRGEALAAHCAAEEHHVTPHPLRIQHPPQQVLAEGQVDRRLTGSGTSCETSGRRAVTSAPGCRSHTAASSSLRANTA